MAEYLGCKKCLAYIEQKCGRNATSRPRRRGLARGRDAETPRPPCVAEVHIIAAATPRRHGRDGVENGAMRPRQAATGRDGLKNEKK